MSDLMPVSIMSDLIRTVLVTVIDRPAYIILDLIYRVFFQVATADILSNEIVRTVYYRCQMVIGIFMLFKFAVTILEGIVDPTKITDKKQGAGKIITRIITSLVILALITPINIPNPKPGWETELNNNGIIFGALYSLQDRILNNNTLGKLILGTLDNEKTKTNNSVAESASQFTKSIAKGFIRYNLKDSNLANLEDPTSEKYRGQGYLEYEDIADNLACKSIDPDVAKVYDDGSAWDILSLVNTTCGSQRGGLWGTMSGIASKIFGTDSYVFAYSPIGGICAYIIAIILIGFTVDIAIRTIKLAVLRLIAPIPIISHMNISAKESKGTDSFSLWVKAVTTTYIDLFVRLAVLYFVIAIIQEIISPAGVKVDLGTGFAAAIAFVFIVIGLLLFARQAPKFFQDVLGLQGTMSNIGLSAIVSGAGALRQGGSLRDARYAVEDSVDNNINAINSGKAPPSVGMAYNAGRDLAAQMITGNDKMTAKAMNRGRGILSHEGITPNIASKYKNDMYLQKGILQAMEDAQTRGPNDHGQYEVNYDTGQTTPTGQKIYATKYIDKDQWANAIAKQRGRTTDAESAYNDMKAEQQKYGQTVGYREKNRGRKHPYLSARRQRRNAANHTSTMGENWHDNTAEDFNRDNGVNPVIGDQL